SAHKTLLCAPAERSAIIAAIASPNTKIVSLTVTEAAYLMTPDGDFDESHPAWKAEQAGEGVTIHGILLEALATRRTNGLPPPTLLPCDNLTDNGARLRHLLLQAAEAAAPALRPFLSETLATPSTMVDRITPATTDADRAAVATIIGTEDCWPIVTEPFWQWVVEDTFPLGRPDWEPFGVTMTHDVRPFETMKLRLLNGAHSAIAYAGLLAGHETVADAFADPDIAAFVARLWQSSATTLPDATREQAPAYTQALATRFTNPALRHLCAQIAGDGSQKLPHRILAPARDVMASGAPLGPLPAVIALWGQALCLPGTPFIEPLSTLREAVASPPDQVARTLLHALGAGDAFVPEVTAAITLARESGPRALIQRAGKEAI
ncbi:MAG: mannitol dehydrogenase family protein, partial [Pseudomonadota bacterium]